MVHSYEEQLKMQGITLEMFYEFTHSDEHALMEQMGINLEDAAESAVAEALADVATPEVRQYLKRKSFFRKFK